MTDPELDERIRIAADEIRRLRDRGFAVPDDLVVECAIAIVVGLEQMPMRLSHTQLRAIAELRVHLGYAEEEPDPGFAREPEARVGVRAVPAARLLRGGRE